MLLDHYDNYYQLSTLRSVINKLSDNEKKVLYIKNNFPEFIKVKEVKEVITRLINKTREDNMIEEIDLGGKMAKIVNPYKNEKVKDDIKLLGDMTKELAFGFHFYEGDWINGEYQETMVDIVENIQRDKIGGMDTDSNITTLLKDKLQILDEYKEVIGDKKDDFIFTEVTLVLIIMTMYVYCIQRGLREYATAIGVAERLLFNIDLECEIVIEQDHLTVSKKNYILRNLVKDFMLKLGGLSTKGIKIKKSDSNIAAASEAEEDISNYLMQPIKDLKYKEFINKIFNHTEKMVSDMKSDSFIIDRKTKVKVQDVDDISWGDTRMKAIRLWDKFFPESPIEVPGALGIIRIKLTEELLEEYQEKYPNDYKIIMQQAMELLQYKIVNKFGGRVDIIMNGNDNDSDTDDVDNDEDDEFVERDDSDKDDLIRTIREQNSEVKNAIKAIINILNGKWDKKKFDKEQFDSIIKILNSLNESDKKIVNKIFGVANKVDITKFACSNINRLAVPIDINTVPELIKRNNFEIMDIEAVSEYEHLLSPLLFGLSISTPKNKSKNGVITNILRAF